MIKGEFEFAGEYSFPLLLLSDRTRPKSSILIEPNAVLRLKKSIVFALAEAEMTGIVAIERIGLTQRFIVTECYPAPKL